MITDTIDPWDWRSVTANATRNREMQDAVAAEANRLQIETLEAYWRDPAKFEAEREAGQAEINALFGPHEARVRAELEAIWNRDN